MISLGQAEKDEFGNMFEASQSFIYKWREQKNDLIGFRIFALRVKSLIPAVILLFNWRKF